MHRSCGPRAAEGQASRKNPAVTMFWLASIARSSPNSPGNQSCPPSRSPVSGTTRAEPAASTPGRLSIRPTRAAAKRRPRSVSYPPSRRSSPTTSRPATRKPGAVRAACRMERASSSAQTTRSTDRATWATTKIDRARSRGARPPRSRLSVHASSARVDVHAGTRPDARPVTAARTTENAMTRQSTPRSMLRFAFGISGIIRSTKRMAPHARAAPTTAPARKMI